MTSLVLADAIHRLTLRRVVTKLDQAPVGQLSTRLERDVELAIPVEALIAKLVSQHRGDLPGESGGRYEDARRPGAKRCLLGVAEVRGGGGPTRQCSLELSAIDHGGREQARGPKQLAPEVLGVQLLVFPSPDQRLANEGAGVLADVESGDTVSNGLFPSRRPPRSARAGGPTRAVVGVLTGAGRRISRSNARATGEHLKEEHLQAPRPTEPSHLGGDAPLAPFAVHRARMNPVSGELALRRDGARAPRHNGPRRDSVGPSFPSSLEPHVSVGGSTLRLWAQSGHRDQASSWRH